MIDDQTFKVLTAIMQLVIMPVAAFVWFIYQRQQSHATSIAVLQATLNGSKESHQREVEEIRQTSRAIMAKLDSIEEALRK